MEQQHMSAATLPRPNIAQMEKEIAAIDPAPWRADFSEGDLFIWFHADLARNPKRILISMDEKPSKNERAAATFLVHSREYVESLIAYIRELEAQTAKETP